MGFISKPGMVEFVKMSGLSWVDNGGVDAWDANLAHALDRDDSTYASVSDKITVTTGSAKGKVDLGEVYMLNSIRAKVGVWANNNYATVCTPTVLLRVSVDGTNWTTIDTWTDNTTLKNTTDAETTHTFQAEAANYRARYIGIEITIAGTTGTDNEARLYELWAAGVSLTEDSVI